MARDYCPFCGEGYGSPNDPCLKGAWADSDKLKAFEEALKSIANILVDGPRDTARNVLESHGVEYDDGS